MKIELLEDLYKQQIIELYDGERQARRSLNKMARATSTPELQQSFRRHARETKIQLQRLETIMGRLGLAEKKKKSKLMAGILAEAKELLKSPSSDRDLMDTALSLAEQKVETMEIFTYDRLAHFARLLGANSDAELLGQTMEEEKRMLERIAALSESLSVEAAETEVQQKVA
jgi:ferritin-like metal-binding protein YciE